MADLKVSELISASVVQKQDLLYLVQDGISKNVDAATLFESISDPALAGNISLSGPVQVLRNSGAVSISTTRTELYAGSTANAASIVNGTILPSTIFLYTPGVTGSSTGFQVVADTGTTKSIVVTYANNKIKLNGFFPNQYVGPTNLYPFMEGYKFTTGSTYIFDVSHPTNAGNVLSFSTSIDGTNTLGTEYTANVFRNGTPGTAGANVIFQPGVLPIDSGGSYFLSILGGTDGQIKVITLMDTQGGSFNLSGNIRDNLTLSFRRKGESALLLYSGDAWTVIGATPGLTTPFTGTSDDIPEGQKLFFTNARARLAISGGYGIDYDSNTGVISANAVALTNLLSNIQVVLTTDVISEGNVNLYFTNTRARAAVANLITSASDVTGNVANVIFVATNGNDNNPGNSLEKPVANIHTALNRANAWTTVRVASGQYTLYQQPVTIKARVALVGDNLRTTSVYPERANVDMFYVENGSYVTGFTFRNHVSPAAVFSYNPNGSAGTIITSPYIQNCSSITTTGTGMRVNGAFVSGLRSMVCDSYTQTNEGGIGIHMLNRGYTQLVSVFTICCNIGILCEDGGFCSITNSNTSFGTYGLVARGVSLPLYNGTFVSQDADNASNILLSNLSVKPNYGDAVLIANYNQTKCARDTGLIVDALAFDILYGGNTEATFAGLQYWSQSESAIPNQATETIAALNYAKNLATNVAQNILVSPIYQSANLQIQDAAQAGGLDSQYKINDEFYIITDIIQNGTVGVTDRIISNRFPANSTVSINKGANLLYNNKSFIQSEVVKYVQATYPAFTFDTNKCFRDVGYIIDSIVFDMRHDGNKQAVTSGVYYYNFSSTTSQINDQVVQTGAAYDYIGSWISKLIRNKPIVPYDVDKCSRDANLIVDTLVIDLAYGSNTQSVFAGLQYWEQTTSAIPGQSTETIAALNYARDISQLIIANTLVTGVKQDNVVQIRGLGGTAVEANIIGTEFNLVANIIDGGTVGVTDRIIPNGYPATSNVTINNAANLLVRNNTFIKAEVVAFVNQTYPSFVYDSNTCARDVGFILDAITFDLRHGGNKQAIISGVYYYNHSNTMTQIYDQIEITKGAYNYIGSLISNVVTKNAITPYQAVFTQNTTAASAATSAEYSDVANNILLINSIITSGPSVAPPKRPIVYNTTGSNTRSNAAILINANKNFIVAETLQYVNRVLADPPYQTTVLQNTSAAAAATVAEANLILNNIEVITDIITEGPGVAPPKQPIGLTLTTNTNVINAARIILANKDFIKAEVVEYVNQNWSNIRSNTAIFYTVNASSPLVNNTSVVTLLEVPNENFIAGSKVSFHQPSYISASSHTMEYVGSGDVLATALPYNGGVPVQANEVVEERGGLVYYTSTDHLGDFRIGDNFTINRVDGTITGRTFTKALFSVLTPYILAIEG